MLTAPVQCTREPPTHRHTLSTRSNVRCTQTRIPYHPALLLFHPLLRDTALAMLVLCLPRACTRVPYPRVPKPGTPLYHTATQGCSPNGSLDLSTRCAAHCASRCVCVFLCACVRARVWVCVKRDEDIEVSTPSIRTGRGRNRRSMKLRKTSRLQPASNSDRAQSRSRTSSEKPS